MTDPSLDVVAVGHALVDVLSATTDEFIDAQGLAKGGMALIDEDRATDLYGQMGPGTEMSGGSAANTAVGVTSFGGRAAFIGRVRDDELGRVFAHDIRAAAVRFDNAPAADGAPTGRCLVLVSPDAERTMNTFLGAAAQLHPNDVAEDLVRAAAVTYLEGYLFDEPDAKAAFRLAANTAHDAGRRVALSLSDTFCVERHRADFLALVEHDVDVLFANDAEACALYETSTLDDALDAVVRQCEVAAVTRSAAGSVIVGREDRVEVPARPVDRVVDTTGAGDLFAAGFLVGFTRGEGLRRCGELGSLAAAEVISHFGARPERRLADLVASPPR
ncbi:MAG TPA: adenosine kinase [Acidimicrobiia bacterium]|nr:adenosine kinase [Acidimicrobiia bacterium]HWW44945.1 adenosine kinase [Acidimicrobiia bacterium]